MTKVAAFIDWNEVNSLATKSAGKFSVFIAGGLWMMDEPKEKEILNAIHNGLANLYGVETPETNNVKFNLMNSGLYLFESDVEAWNFYEIFSKKPVYASVVYASIYSPTEGCLDENT